MPNFVVKLPKNDETSFFSTQTLWIDQEIDISIFDGVSAWAGRFSKEDALAASKTLGLPFDEYWAETRLALSTNHGADKFQYFLVDSRFTWVKLMEKDVEKKLEYGSVALEPALLSLHIERMIDSLIDLSNCLLEKLKSTEEENLRVESARQLLVKTLHRHTSEKRAMEDSLYSNFLEILNAKKQKIAALQAHQSEPKMETKTAPKASGSRAKPVEWRKTVQARPLQRAKKAKKAVDAPLEQQILLEPRRRLPETLEAKKKVALEKPVLLVEAIKGDNDGYGSDTDIDKPPNRQEPTRVVEVVRGVNAGYDSDTDIDDPLKENEPIPAVEAARVVNLHGFNSDINEPPTVKEGPSLSFLFEDFLGGEQEYPMSGGLGVTGREVQTEIGCSKQPVDMSRSQRQEFDTQKFLDELGI